MKKIKMHRYAIMLFLLLILHVIGRAQPIITPANNPDQTISTDYPNPAPGLLSVDGLNSDMLDLGTTTSTTGNDKLWAVVWDNAKSNSTNYPYGIQIGVESNTYSFSAQTTIPLSISNINSVFPDVALGSYYDVSTSSVKYILAVVYSVPTGAWFYTTYIETYDISIDNVNQTVTAAQIVSPKQVNNNGMSAFMPHIDLSADPTGYTSGSYVPLMHNFVIVWSETNTNTGLTEIWGTRGDLATLTNSTSLTTTNISTDGIFADVGVTLDPTISGTINRAYIVYADGSTWTNLKVSEWDLVSGAVGTAYAVGSCSTHFNRPRIDAVTLFDYNSSNGIIWRATDFVADVSGTPTPPAGVYDIYHASGYNIGSSYFTTNYFDSFFFPIYIVYTPSSSPYMFPFSFQNTFPAVSGTGDFLGGGESPGKDEFSYSFYSTVLKTPTCIGAPGGGCYTFPSGAVYSFSSVGAYYSYGIGNSFFGAGGGTNPGKYAKQVNYSTLNNMFNTYHSTYTNVFDPVPSSISNCTNSGYDVLVAWFDADASGIGNIRYKFGGTTSSFKTNSITNINKAKIYKIYPNPTKDYLTVDGTEKASYCIIDALGKKMAQGSITNKDNIVNTSALPFGVYILELNENGYSKKMKFTKE